MRRRIEIISQQLKKRLNSGPNPPVFPEQAIKP
jgi:hypothetical protein